jgi:hypothetical protein
MLFTVVGFHGLVLFNGFVHGFMVLVRLDLLRQARNDSKRARA